MDAKLHLGPLVISDVCNGVSRTSTLSQIAIVNGLLTVCSPDILLDDIVLNQNVVLEVSTTILKYLIIAKFDLIKAHFLKKSS